MTVTYERSTTALSLDEMLELVSVTEDLDEQLFELGTSDSFFQHSEGGNLQFVLGDQRLNLTADSYAQACKIIGLPSAYADRTPMNMITEHLNYWFNALSEERKILTKNGALVAFLRPRTELYSTEELITSLVSTFESMGGSDFYFDKVHHDLFETQFSLVMGNYNDVHETGNVLNAGVQVQNSVLGLKPTLISAYVANPTESIEGGSISTRVYSQWKRRNRPTNVDALLEDVLGDANAAPETVYSWAEGVARLMYPGLVREISSINRLRNMNIGNHAGTFFNDICVRYKIPTVLRRVVQEEYASQPSQSVFDLWSAIAATAGRDEVQDNVASRRHMMLVAGELAAHPDSCGQCHRLLEE
jgi:hypothetical protein